MLLLEGWFLIVCMYLLTRFGEHRVHRINYDFLIFAGGEEILLPRMKYLYALGFAVIPAALIEYIFLSFPYAHHAPLQLMGLSLLFVSLLLRYWTIQTLGARWSMRCIFVNGYPKSQQGPYRWLRHPEYLARAFDIMGISIYLGSFYSLFICIIVHLALSRNIAFWELFQVKRMSQNA